MVKLNGTPDEGIGTTMEDGAFGVSEVGTEGVTWITEEKLEPWTLVPVVVKENGTAVMLPDDCD